jgi:hypothetical protein
LFYSLFLEISFELLGLLDALETGAHLLNVEVVLDSHGSGVGLFDLLDVLLSDRRFLLVGQFD